MEMNWIYFSGIDYRCGSWKKKRLSVKGLKKLTMVREK
jgi:hypothetical protein